MLYTGLVPRPFLMGTFALKKNNQILVRPYPTFVPRLHGSLSYINSLASVQKFAKTVDTPCSYSTGLVGQILGHTRKYPVSHL